MEFDSGLITSCQREAVVYKVHNSEPHVASPPPRYGFTCEALPCRLSLYTVNL